jgi:hypothetical protein
VVQDEVVVPVIEDHYSAGLDHLVEVVDGSLVILIRHKNKNSLKNPLILSSPSKSFFTLFVYKTIEYPSLSVCGALEVGV